jgi:hypothetical protein
MALFGMKMLQANPFAASLIWALPAAGQNVFYTASGPDADCRK